MTTDVTPFDFATAGRILFGPGKLAQLPAIAGALGRRPALVTGASAERIMPVFRALKAGGCEPAAFSISGEPTVERTARIAEQVRDQGCDFVVAFGGGSVIDAGKAIAALLSNRRDLMDYLEVIGRGEPLEVDPVPCIAIPTTAGTGAEVTRNAVLRSEEHRVKVSMRHPGMLPTVALVDPELTLSMPPEVTAGTGLDALTQLLEAFVSVRANPLTDALCRDALPRVIRALPRAYTRPGDLAARTEMALGSLFGGMALANAGLGAVHGFAGPIGGMFDAPHGMVCAALLPAVVETNMEALEQRAPDHPARAKFEELRRMLGCDSGYSPALRLRELCMSMMVPGLADYGMTAADIPVLVEKAGNASSMKGNPVQFTEAELTDILETSLSPPVDGESTIYI